MSRNMYTSILSVFNLRVQAAPRAVTLLMQHTCAVYLLACAWDGQACLIGWASELIEHWKKIITL